MASTRKILAKSDFAEFSMPDFFVLNVKRNKGAIDFLSEQLKDSSLLVPWLKALKDSLRQRVGDDDE